MHEKLIEAADALEAQIRAVKPRTVYLDAAANTCHGVRDHLRSDQKAVEAAAADQPNTTVTVEDWKRENARVNKATDAAK